MDPTPYSKIRTLVVDDVTSARRVVTKILGELGFNNVVEAKSGKEAVEKLGQEVFQLVISDQEMPDMSGMDLVRHIRGKDSIKHLPVIMVTSSSDKGQVMEAIKAGVNDYVVKPVSVDLLLTKIRRVFAAMSQRPAAGG